MLTQEIIIKRRNKEVLSREEISQFVRGVADGSVSEGQVAAFCMTACLNPMTREERVGLTLAMARSGAVLEWAEAGLGGPVLDKHSTGGVGDKVSLMLAPVLAACGGFVPMLSGRGLGHTGGTLDKMDAIPGYVSQPGLDVLRKVVKDVGCAIVGATKELAPADRVMYAVRDVTGTVESLDLITASILSKKMAAGLNGLVMDVKFGSGAFMQDYAAAKALAESIHGVANGGGLPCTVLMTDMNEVLGRTAGNAIEVVEAIEFLRGEAVDSRLYLVTLHLCAEALVLGGLAADVKDGIEKADTVLKNGRAAEIFEKMVAALGGPGDIIRNYKQHLKIAPLCRDVYPAEDGVVRAVDVRALGYAVIALGGGRRVVSDRIDHGVGLDKVAGLGEKVGKNAGPLCTMAGADEAKMNEAERLIRAAFTVGDSGDESPVIRERMAAGSH